MGLTPTLNTLNTDATGNLTHWTMKKKAFTPDDLVRLLQKNAGNVSKTAKALGVSRQTLYTRIKQEPALKEAVEQAVETVLDEAESVLYRKAINEGETTSLIFLLKTRGKSRGYVERAEQQVEVTVPPKPLIIDWRTKVNTEPDSGE